MNFRVTCTDGPYWLEAEECFAYTCMLNGKEIIIAEENEDGFRYVYKANQKTYNLYTKNKNIIAPLIAKAINNHKLKEELIPSTLKTFGDLIDEL